MPSQSRSCTPFHGEHATDLAAQQRDLEAVVAQLPAKSCRSEAEELQQQLEAIAQRRGPQPLADIIQVVLARLAARLVQSTPSESAAP